MPETYILLYTVLLDYYYLNSDVDVAFKRCIGQGGTSLNLSKSDSLGSNLVVAKDPKMEIFRLSTSTQLQYLRYCTYF